VGEVPFIGNWLTRLLRGGDTIGTLTLSRFYVAHVFLIPACIFAFIGVHIVLFRKAGPAGPIEEDPITPKLAPEGFYPRQVLMDMAFALLIMIGLGILAYFHPVGLGPIADPANTQFLPRPEWYYLSFFEWLKFWEGPKVVIAVLVVPGILALLFFLLPFLDRSLERRPWRRPIPVLSVAIVLAVMVYLGVRSRLDDARDPSVAAQLATQEQQEKAYGAAPFEPYLESPGGTAPATAVSGPVNPLVAHGRSIFEAHGCAACHGPAGVGTPIAPALVGITAKFQGDQLATLLQHPDAKMIAGHMPAVDASATDMAALLAYLGALGTPAANAPASHGAVVAEQASGATQPDANAPGAPTRVSESGPSTPATNAGHQFFEQRGCAACHGTAGIGGRAPAISSLIAGRSNAQLLQVLKVPNAKMKAGGMQPVEAEPAQLASLVAYMRTLAAPQPAKPGTAVANNSVPAPNSELAAPASSEAPPASTTPPVAAAPTASVNPGKAVFVSQGCAACHGSNAGGTHFAPALTGVSTKFPGAALPNLLHHPDAKMRAGGMPPVTANPAEIKQLVAYLTSLDIAPTAAPAASGARAAGSAPAPAIAGTSTLPAHAAPAVPMSPLAVRGQQVFQHFSCQTCHGAGGLHGTAAAPGLAGTASILPAATLENLLRHHSTQMKNGNMPQTNMNASDMKALIAYVRAMPSTPDAQ
jgi:mono/diheme cytochrome c family protein